MTKSENRQRLAFAAAFLLVLATTFALPSKAADIAKAQEHAASVRRAQTLGAEFERGLTTELQKENRDDSWASRQESELRASYKSGSDLPQNGLSSIECRYSKCVIQLRVDASTPEDAIAQLNAINRWISTGQACGYTLIPVGNTGALQDEVRIFLGCFR
jgi:hypothetical protein